MTVWPAGIELVVLQTVDSTNSEARRRVEAGITGPLWVAAKQQTEGRGRQGRSWRSPPGNLFATGLFPIDGTPADAARLSFVAALAVADVLDALAGTADIALKWPNDVLLNRKKISGILLESFGTDASGRISLAMGIGLNLRHHPPADGAVWPPTSVEAETGTRPDFDRALLLLADRIAHWMQTIGADGFGAVRAAWLQRAINLGKQIEVRLPSKTITGIFCDLDTSGALVLDQAGQRTAISAGDVFFPRGAQDAFGS